MTKNPNGSKNLSQNETTPNNGPKADAPYIVCDSHRLAQPVDSIKMVRVDKAGIIRNAFLDGLKSFGASVQTMPELAAKESTSNIGETLLRLGRAGREVYLVPGIGFINVHVRSEPPGWWNILKTVKKDLEFLSNTIGINCFFVLLVGRNDPHIADGYIATDFVKPPFIGLPGVEETKYTINERQHLDSNSLLLSVGKVAKVLLETRKTT